MGLAVFMFDVISDSENALMKVNREFLQSLMVVLPKKLPRKLP